ncbi:hypothetical protein Tco_1548030 [Tanacetum coccineum]
MEVSSIRRIQGLDTAYKGFLGVGTTFDIFYNIHILYLEYSVLSLYGYDVLNFTPLWYLGFHCSLDGEVGNKGIARLISHLKTLHLSTNERKCVLREAISIDHGLYMAVEETLKVFGQWLCGKCMTLHAVTHDCHHPDGLVRFSIGSDNMSGYIVGISKPSNKET